MAVEKQSVSFVMLQLVIVYEQLSSDGTWASVMQLRRVGAAKLFPPCAFLRRPAPALLVNG